MSDLQIILIILAVVIIGGVLLYNRWSEARARKKMERSFEMGAKDVLMDDTPMPPQNRTERIEPGFFNTVPLPEEHKEQKWEKPQPYMRNMADDIDDLIDCVIPIIFDAPVSGRKILSSIPPLSTINTSPVRFFGRLTEDFEKDRAFWIQVSEVDDYMELLVVFPLAHRLNSLDELSYSEFISRIQHISSELGGVPDVPDMDDVMKRSLALSDFIQAHDAKLSLNVRLENKIWDKTSLIPVLEGEGLVVIENGAFVKCDDNGRVIFSLLMNHSGEAEIDLLTLLLDVPCVSAEQGGFQTMLAVARSLVAKLDGILVDDGDNFISDETLSNITIQVQNFYEEMSAVRIPAGSERALRLFS